MAYDHWCTPPWLADIINKLSVTTDPCSNEWSFVKAGVRHMGNPSVPNDDGLEVPWHGSIFVNPPYSNPGPWAARWINHPAPRLWLSEGSVGTKWFNDVIQGSEVVWFFHRRLAFYDPRKEDVVKGARSGHILCCTGFDLSTYLVGVATPMKWGTK